MFSREYSKSMGETKFLDEETERNLIRRYRLENDLAAREQLVKAFMKFVVKMARDHKNKTSCTVELTDLISEGMLGFIVCLDKLNLDFFEPGPKKIRLATYAFHWVKAFLNKPDNNNNSIVQKLTGNRKSVFFGLNRAMKSRGYSHPLNGAEISILAVDLKAREEDIITIINSSSGDISMDVEHFTEVGVVVSGEGSEEDRVLKSIDATGIKTVAAEIMETKMDARERDILTNRTLSDDPMKLEHFATKYSVSRMQIKNVENGAIAKLKRGFRERGHHIRES